MGRITNFLKKKQKKAALSYRQTMAAREIRMQKAKAAYLQAKEKEAISLAQSKAKLQRQLAEKQLKARYSGTSPGFFSLQPTGAASPSYFKPSQPMPVKKAMPKKKKGKSKGKYIIRGGKAYPIA